MAAPAKDDAWLRRNLGTPGADAERVAARVRREPERIATLIEGLRAETAPVKFGSSKVLRCLSEVSPDLLYSRFDFFARQMDSPNSFLAWDAARIVANLAAVDTEGRVERLIDRYLAPIAGPQMIAAATAMAGGATIALAKPHLAERIAAAILGVECAAYRTDECVNIAKGHAVVAFERFYRLLECKEEVRAFVGRQLLNPRSGTRSKAGRWLKKHPVASVAGASA
jgi:hypothetical protein